MINDDQYFTRCKWHIVPYNIFGVKLWAVENYNGYIKTYCDSKADAVMYSDKLNELTS